jgi:hypothetical protein
LQSFNLATIHHFQSEGIDKILSTWLKQNIFLLFKRDKQDVKEQFGWAYLP